MFLRVMVLISFPSASIILSISSCLTPIARSCVLNASCFSGSINEAPASLTVNPAILPSSNLTLFSAALTFL